ncbi:MAG TPA: helix-turn-helix domain-containing protein [Burkholderiaceae bacterium]
MNRISFAALNLTELESDVYLVLLTKGESSGYAVAKELNKAVANVYKALDSLSEKGAAVMASGGTRLYCAVPWKDVLANASARFAAGMDDLTRQLEALPEPQNSEAVYQLENMEQAVADGRRLIEQARFMLLADLDPLVVGYFAEALTAAASRGVEVRVKVYASVDLPGVLITLRERGAEVSGKLDSSSFKISADGERFAMALLDVPRATLIQAFKSSSGLMNMSIYLGLVHELILTELKPALARSDLAHAQRVLQETAHLHPFSTENPVFQSYKQRYHKAAAP